MIRSSRLLALAVLVAAVGCKGSTPPRQVSGDPPNVVNSNNAFALDLYGRAREANGNICQAPYSAWTALAMTAAGARGETADEMARVLHLPVGDDRTHAASAKLMRELTAKGKADRPELMVANALWAQQGYPFREEFLALGRTHYDAELATLDFAGGGAGPAINAWVAKQTGDRIKELVREENLSDNTVLVLTNATYFKADWQRPFSKHTTRRRPFFLANGGTAEVDLMEEVFDGMSYMDEPGFQAVVLPYRGNRFSLAVLLPRKEDGLAAFEKELTADKLTGWLARCKPRPVDVYLPRFQFSSGGSLKGPLTALGMRCAFDRSRADFSGMSPTKELFVSEVVQQTFVAVNEEGAEAAGATAIYMEKKDESKEEAPGPTAIVFRADHPFLFLIRDERSGCILFAGRLTDPRTAQPRESKRVPRDLEQPPPKKKADE